MEPNDIDHLGFISVENNRGIRAKISPLTNSEMRKDA